MSQMRNSNRRVFNINEDVVLQIDAKTNIGSMYVYPLDEEEGMLFDQNTAKDVLNELVFSDNIDQANAVMDVIMSMNQKPGRRDN